MGFAGNLRTLGLPEVFQTLARIQATGVLRLAAQDGGREIIFDQGNLIGVAWRDADARQALLRRLVLDGRIHANDAAEISSSGRESQVLARLIEQGVVDEATVEDLTGRQAVESLHDLFTWEVGDFVFVDAGPDEDATNDAIDRARKHPLQVNLNSLLMESARRQDEWQRYAQIITDPSMVLGPKHGAEAALAEAAKEWPASAVIPLVDAVRSVEDIVREGVATRLEVYEVLAAQTEAAAIVPLSRDDIIYHADFLAKEGQHAKAVSLYRRALASRPGDAAVAAKLAEITEQLGDVPEAAQGWAQLAVSCLNAQDAATGARHAMRAVSLQPKDTRIRQVLVRALLAQQTDETREMAAGELVIVADRYLELGQLEDARSACLQVLEVDKAHEGARRRLSRIFAAAARDEQSEDVVVCVQCGHTNHREAATCEKCKAALQLSCLACGRVVGVSDRLCIFCGADPHGGNARRGSHAGSPATSRIVDPNKVRKAVADRGTEVWKSEMLAKVEEAKACEAAGNLDKALELWRELLAQQTDNQELSAHIRRLETTIHDTFVERAIEQGHGHRRVRHFWRAIASYKAALRSMSADDSRAQRLTEILASTRKLALRVAAIYAAAFLLIGAVAVLAVKPMLLARELGQQLDAVETQVVDLEAAPANQGLMQAIPESLQPVIDRLEPLGAEPRWTALRTRVTGIQGRIAVARSVAARSELDTIAAMLKQGDLKRAAGRLEQYDRTFPEFQSPRQAQLEQQLAAETKARAEIAKRVEAAPALLAQGKAHEAAGRFGEALSTYRDLADSPAEDAAQQAKAAIGRLEPLAAQADQAAGAALQAAARLAKEDLVRAAALLDEAMPAAAAWNLQRRIEGGQALIAAARKAATAAAQALDGSEDEQALAAFLAEHAGAPESAAIRQRHQQATRTRVSRESAVNRYRSALADNRTEDAFAAAKDLLTGFPGQFKPGEIRLPVLIESTPSGAAVAVDGKPAGTTPLRVQLDPAARGTVTITAVGWQPASTRAETLTTAWRHQFTLERAPAWTAELGKAAHLMSALGSGFAVVGGDQLALVDRSGSVRGRGALAGGELSGSSKALHLPVQVGDRLLAAGATGEGLLLLALSGAEQQRIPSRGEIRGRPLAYVNEAFGPGARVAAASSDLFSVQPGGAVARIPLRHPAISGPVALELPVDQALVIADTRGRLVAFEESTKRQLWEADLRANDAGQLVRIGGDGLAVVLDGSRLACWTISGSGAQQRWSQDLGATSAGDPAVGKDAIWAAAGKELGAWDQAGAVLGQIALPAAASAAPAASGDLAVTGCQDGTLIVAQRRGDSVALKWSTVLPAAVTAVAIGPDLIVAATADGRLTAYAP